jgi:hypothetical protein
MLSRPDLNSFFMSLFWFGQGVSCGGHSVFHSVLFCVLYFYVFGLVCFPIRGSCQSLSLIENHTYVACSHLCLWVVVSCFVFFSPYRTVSSRSLSLLFFVIQCSVYFILFTMNT